MREARTRPIMFMFRPPGSGLYVCGERYTNPMRDKLIYVVGPLKLQNTLMASFLERETGVKCLAAETLRDIPPREDKSGAQSILVLWDCLGKDFASCLADFESNAKDTLVPPLLAFFNLSRGLGVEGARSTGGTGFLLRRRSSGPIPQRDLCHIRGRTMGFQEGHDRVPSENPATECAVGTA